MKKVWIIIFLGLSIYGFALFNGFVWDDEMMFQAGASLQANAYFRPVISAVYWTIHNVFGPRPFFFHFFQLIFHIATAIMIYYLFKRFFKETVALILAIIFLVHPALVEAVSFASSMQEVAFTLTGLVGLYLFVNTEEKMDPHLRGDDKRKKGDDIYVKVFFGTLLLLIALLMKETAVVFFVLIFCYVFLFKRKSQVVLISYSIFAVILLMGYFLFRVSGGNLYVQGQGLFPIMRVSLAIRLINIPMIIFYYLGKFFYPMNLGIAQHWVVRTIDFQNFWWPLIVDVGFLILLISGFVFVSSPRRRGSMDSHRSLPSTPIGGGNDFFFFFLWFLIGLLPHLQFVALNMTVAERWLYFPMIGLLGMTGALISKIGDYRMDSRRGSSLLITLGIIVIVLFSVRSFIRTLDWKNGLTLFGHDIKKTSSFDLQNNMGVELFRVGRYGEAKKYFEISVKLAPYWWVNWNNLGAIYEREKNYQKAAEYYQKAIDNGQYYLAIENLSKLNTYLQEKNNQK